VNLARKHRRGFDESSASSDIAFLLIIYFIVIAGFTVNNGFLMNLPAKDSARRIPKEDLLRFQLDDDGRILYQGEARSAAGAAGILRSAAAANPNSAVLLAVSPNAPWQQVVTFVALAQELAIDSFSFTLSSTPSSASSAQSSTSSNRKEGTSFTEVP
jgi:biopolymer transport protein ExbD